MRTLHPVVGPMQCAIHGYATGVSHIGGTCLANRVPVCMNPDEKTVLSTIMKHIISIFFILAPFWNSRKILKWVCGAA